MPIDDDRVQRFMLQPGDFILTQCSRCANYQDDLKCPAFPNRPIPEEIYDNRHDHRDPYPGDNGIQFIELIPEPEPESGE